MSVPSRSHAVAVRPRLTRRLPWLALLLTIPVLAVGCGDDDPTGPEPAGEVDETGGTIQAQGGKVRLSVPPGAVAGNLKITVEPAQSPPPDAGLLQSSAFDFGPDGTQFAQPVQMTIQYDASELPDDAIEGSLALHRAVGNGWQRVEGSTVDEGGNRVTAPVTSFSVYAVIFLGAPQDVFTSGDAQTAVVGEEVATPPSVQVRNEDGEPLPGVEVTFSVVEGGGTVTGANQVTDAEGRATVGSWTVGTTAGPQLLQATVEGLDTPVEFEAVAVAGPAATLTRVQGDEQTATAGTEVDVPPGVRVSDQFDNPVSGAEVGFVADANGTVDPGSVTSGDDGTATVDAWTLGDVGENTLTASASGVSPVVFTATAEDPCDQLVSLTLGETVQGDIASTDCQSGGGRMLDRYGLTLSQQTAFRGRVLSSEINPGLFLFDPSQQIHGAGSSEGSVVVDYVLPPDSYVLWAAGPASGETGAYSFDTEVKNDDPTSGCLRLATVVTGEVDIAGQIADGDCVVDFLGQPGTLRRFDHYARLIFPGETLTATVTADYQYALSIITDSSDGITFIEEVRNQSPGVTRSLSFSPDQSIFVVFTHWNERDGETGNYDISFTVTGQPEAALRTDDAIRIPEMLIRHDGKQR